MTLALIAGRGDLPAAVHRAAGGAVVCGYEGVTLSGLTADLTFRLETLGTLLVQLGERGVTEVCFAGGIDRPTLDPTKLDAETAPLVPLFMEGLKKGDDGALGVVVDLFERTGFTVRGAHEIAPDLLAEGGVYGQVWPDAQMRGTATLAAAHLLKLSPQDIGQACVVGRHGVIAMEDADGTDAMLARVAAQGQDAILFKGPKAQQSRLVDLPTVGPATFEAAARAGLRGVVVDAGDVIVLDAPACTAAADAHGLVFWARTGE
ncbi:UDP-2,3-diacylglucosamine diphosphatase LpxI [Sulfitobacter albidus]|uniref:UDP-2,3-diacylglucosamine diphosphatase LpxI n=1 Tax=Sulfitobacter albidus TaxID=2829501 RepID=A0A975JGK1_9RHOB|nr:UDP-2,3-diacylglucosamine diphosphatase LpxI [Sulfitobacter albidus]QUJ77580.1 UDP-2,3-diacylglucosamine diphosphatase LpxI [Sulfitobacter albidus]